MVKQTFPLRRGDDVVGMTQVLGERDKVSRYQAYRRQDANLTRANIHEAHPRYDSMTDWHGGDTGNDIDVADATQAIAGRNGGIDLDYEPRHQEEKASKMVPVPPLTTDLGIDYAALPGMTGREGIIEPQMPYPASATAEVPETFRESNYIPYTEPEV